MKRECDLIIKHYGKESQVDKALEELIELANVLCKWKKGEPVDVGDIRTEIADNHIMLNQLLLIFGITDSAIEAEVEMKLKRTLNRMSA